MTSLASLLGAVALASVCVWLWRDDDHPAVAPAQAATGTPDAAHEGACLPPRGGFPDGGLSRG